MTALAKPGSVSVIAIGQSLNAGSPSWCDTVTEARGWAGYDAWVTGIAWVQFADPNKTQLHRRADPFQYTAPKVINVFVGGTTDYADSIGRTGAQCYADQVTLAAHIRTIRADALIVGTTTTPSTAISTNEAQRLAGNVLVLADASNAFDAYVDLAGDSTLVANIAANDGTHPNPTGYLRMATLIGTVLDTL